VKRALGWLVALGLAVAGCKPGGLQTFVYACAGGVEARVTNLDATAATIRLEVGTRRWTLARDSSASGAKYTDGDVTFWSKGKEATIEQGGKPLCEDCRLVRTLAAEAPKPGAGPPLDGPTSIVGVEWEWIALAAPGEKVTIDDPARYTLSLGADGRAAARLDCNRATGRYTLDDAANRIDIGAFATTRASCPPESRAERFAQLLEAATVARLADDGTLVLELPGDGGTLRFRAKTGPR
jgi:membrane-bound inhibitor of C-type lysozyme/heat shock protein HslJ